MKKLLYLGLTLTTFACLSNPVEASDEVRLENAVVQPVANGLDSILVHHYAQRHGLQSEGLHNLQKKLITKGFTEEQSVTALRFMLRIIPTVPADGSDFELSQGAQQYFEDQGFSQSQIDLVKLSSQHIAQKRKGNHASRSAEDHFQEFGGDSKQTRANLIAAGFEEKQSEKALMGIVKIMYEMKKEGAAYEMDSRIANYLTNDLALSTDQVATLESEARKVLAGK